MHSLLKIFLLVVTIGSLSSFGFYILATKYEPTQREEIKNIPNIRIHRD